jgi:hypothetical protein
MNRLQALKLGPDHNGLIDWIDAFDRVLRDQGAAGYHHPRASD